MTSLTSAIILPNFSNIFGKSPVIEMLGNRYTNFMERLLRNFNYMFNTLIFMACDWLHQLVFCSRLLGKRRKAYIWISWTSWSMTVYIFWMKVLTRFLNTKNWRLRCRILQNGRVDLLKRGRREPACSTLKKMFVLFSHNTTTTSVLFMN